MKRIISLLLIVIMSCSALVGCDWKDIFNKETSPEWEAPEGVVETTTTDKDGNPITIAHSDNFTQDDIEFVATLRAVLDVVFTPYDTPPSYNLGDIIWMVKAGGSPMFLMHFENPYIICAYLKPNQNESLPNDEGIVYADITQYVWYKFNDNNDIQQTIEGLILESKLMYLLYDCTIVRGIGENEGEYNKECKYYLIYQDESSLDRTTENMIMWYGGKSIIAPDRKFIGENSILTTRYEIFIDGDDREFLVIEGEVYDSRYDTVYDYAYKHLGKYYDALYPYFVRNEELDRIEYRTNGVEYYEKRMIQIDLDILTEFILSD